MKNKVLVVLAVTACLIISVSVLAHHGTGISYDESKVIQVKGVITKFAWQNPHSQLYFDAKDEKGNVVHWAAEMRAPGNLVGNGYTRRGLTEKLKAGAEVTVSGNPSRSGAPVVVFVKAVLADGYCVCENAGGGQEVKQ